MAWSRLLSSTNPFSACLCRQKYKQKKISAFTFWHCKPNICRFTVLLLIKVFKTKTHTNNKVQVKTTAKYLFKKIISLSKACAFHATGMEGRVHAAMKTNGNLLSRTVCRIPALMPLTYSFPSANTCSITAAEVQL